MDGLLGFDPEQLKAMMAQFGATPQDTADANKQAAFALGFGLLQGRKGNELATIGHAGLGAMGARNAALMNSQQLRQEGLKNAMGMAKLAQAAQAQQAAAAGAKEIEGIFSSAPQLQNMGPGGPTPANAAAIAPPSMIDQWRRAAVAEAKRGNSEGAKRYADLANGLEETYNTTPQTVKGPNGEIQLAQFGQRGGVKVAQGLSPAEKLHFADTGGVAGVGINPFTGKVESAGLPKTMTPGETASNKLGWANFGLSKEANARAAANVDTGKWTNDLERGIQINAQTGQSRPITEGGQPIGNKAETKAKQSAGKALDIISEAEKLLSSATGSYGGAAFDKAAQVFGYSTEGATSTAQLQALEGALMLNQPRMEGPQSDKDTAIYKQMAGKIGDPTVPVAQKKAALTAIKHLHERYAGSRGATGGWSATEIK